jgi:hypothetical protein
MWQITSGFVQRLGRPLLLVSQAHILFIQTITVHRCMRIGLWSWPCVTRQWLLGGCQSSQGSVPGPLQPPGCSLCPRIGCALVDHWLDLAVAARGRHPGIVPCSFSWRPAHSHVSQLSTLESPGARTYKPTNLEPRGQPISARPFLLGAPPPFAIQLGRRHPPLSGLLLQNSVSPSSPDWVSAALLNLCPWWVPGAS